MPNLVFQIPGMARLPNRWASGQQLMPLKQTTMILQRNGLTAAFGFCSGLVMAVLFGEAICNPGTPAVAVAGSDQLDSVSLVTPEGVERTTGTASGRRPWWPKDEGQMMLDINDDGCRNGGV
ncbi:uncharacterized protein BKA55DRAFT_244983 [Fusarium redolens]|jgi:hypothetical protein|uniref:Uncharacterized protein n=1 Tax=Fusarium redolens TaxID=48865 RepID=A0A9P9HXY8_FUSRE|nr:uncharacterized protein BKA55DRAFT_244983 [Fusarium redolens]KAH7265296.1 hypothetical protein BKA55DRAFT_244983 [Fusarium redolens]